MPDAPLDQDLVARILEKLQVETSERLREILAQPGDDWSPEALQAASLLLEQRAKGLAAEPEYRTAPIAHGDQRRAPRRLRAGDTVLAPDVALPRGFSRLLFLTRYLQSGCLQPGKLGAVRSQAAYIYFHNGRRGWVYLADVKPLTIDVGTRVRNRWRRQFGTITHWNDQDEKYFIRFDDGQGEWSSLEDFEVPSEIASELGQS